MAVTNIQSTRIRQGDEVVVITGKDKGLQGKVVRVMPKQGRVIVAKANMVKRHTRPSQKSRGGIVEKEAPLALSNVQYYCPKCKTGVRLGARILEDGRKVRTCRKCGEVLDR